jgi:hypothetical protein
MLHWMILLRVFSPSKSKYWYWYWVLVEMEAEYWYCTIPIRAPTLTSRFNKWTPWMIDRVFHSEFRRSFAIAPPRLNFYIKKPSYDVFHLMHLMLSLGLILVVGLEIRIRQSLRMEQWTMKEIQPTIRSEFESSNRYSGASNKLRGHHSIANHCKVHIFAHAKDIKN